MPKLRFVSVQVLLNKDGSLKAQRVYAIPMPNVVSFWVLGVQLGEDGIQESVNVGVMVQEWKTHDILDTHPNNDILLAVLQKSFGIQLGEVSHEYKG